ncbi:MAG: PEP-CTERM sorting domain-containing protein [Chromatiales bacterium]|nr:PEP-CTERM sorting domain-containing protein [Chromatiales bacterium]
MKLKQLVIGSMASLALGMGMSASALPIIQGEILINGNATFDTQSLATATEILSFGATATAGGDGSYAAVPDLTPVTFTPFQFSPVLAPVPVNPLWTFTVGGVQYSFVMSSLSVLEQTASSLQLQGSGLLSIDGFADTDGIWAFSAQSASGEEAVRFSFSSDTSVVSEPGILALLGLGFLGLAFARRR